MARKPKRQRKAPTAPPPRGTSDRDKAVDALMALLAEHPFEDIGLAEVAGRAGLKLSQLRAEFGSTLAIVGAHIKDIDRAVLAGGGGDMAEEPARERLFDVLMRRLEVIAPYQEAVGTARRPHQGHRPRGARRRRRRHGGGAGARAPVRRADAPAGSDRPLQRSGALAAAFGAAQSGPRAGAQRHGGALATVDAGGRRHRRVRPERGATRD